jgi:hypothetical protein
MEKAVGTARREKFWLHTGDIRTGEKPKKSPQDSRDVQRPENPDLFDLVPLWS